MAAVTAHRTAVVDPDVDRGGLARPCHGIERQFLVARERCPQRLGGEYAGKAARTELKTRSGLAVDRRVGRIVTVGRAGGSRDELAHGGIDALGIAARPGRELRERNLAAVTARNRDGHRAHDVVGGRVGSRRRDGNGGTVDYGRERRNRIVIDRQGVRPEVDDRNRDILGYRLLGTPGQRRGIDLRNHGRRSIDLEVGDIRRGLRVELRRTVVDFGHADQRTGRHGRRDQLAAPCDGLVGTHGQVAAPVGKQAGRIVGRAAVPHLAGLALECEPRDLHVHTHIIVRIELREGDGRHDHLHGRRVVDRGRYLIDLIQAIGVVDRTRRIEGQRDPGADRVVGDGFVRRIGEQNTRTGIPGVIHDGDHLVKVAARVVGGDISLNGLSRPLSERSLGARSRSQPLDEGNELGNRLGLGTRLGGLRDTQGQRRDALAREGDAAQVFRCGGFIGCGRRDGDRTVVIPALG